jgi:alkylated DNA repair dioxygenase AlkB
VAIRLYNRRLEEAQDIPAWLIPTIAAVEAFEGLSAGAIRQALCTEYEVGAGIGWHRDRPHFGTIIGLSLASACKFRLRRRNGEAWERFTLETDPRSLYRMSGESRQIWEHSIPPVETPRYSITFRTMAAR